jgi:hypothetical protein
MYLFTGLQPAPYTNEAYTNEESRAAQQTRSLALNRKGMNDRIANADSAA